jgi:hypothetical protein
VAVSRQFVGRIAATAISPIPKHVTTATPLMVMDVVTPVRSKPGMSAMANPAFAPRVVAKR